MQIGNGSIYNMSPATYSAPIGTTNVHYSSHMRPNTIRFRARTFGKIHSRPQGTQPPYSQILAQTSGELACINQVIGEGILTGPGVALGKDLSAPLTGSGTITNAPLALIVWLLSSLTGTTGLTGSMQGSVKLEADLDGVGEIDISTVLGVIAWCLANLAGDGTADGSNLRGEMWMDADITSAGDVVTAKSCAIAVWDEVLADHLTPGSTGAGLNAAGAAGDPWSTPLPGTYPPGSAGYMIHNTYTWVTGKLLTVAKFLGLK